MRQLSEEKAYQLVLKSLEKDRKELKRQEAILQCKIDGLNYALKIIEDSTRVAEPEEVQLAMPGRRRAT
jgi:hypothetical protein